GVIQRERVAEVCSQHALVIGEAVEQVRIAAELIIQLAQQVAFAERRGERSRQALKGGGHRNRNLRMLHSALAIREEEQLVLHDGTAKTAAVLVALKGSIEPRRRRQLGGRGTVAETAEGFAMVAVRARAGGDVNRTGG